MIGRRSWPKQPGTGCAGHRGHCKFGSGSDRRHETCLPRGPTIPTQISLTGRDLGGKIKKAELPRPLVVGSIRRIHTIRPDYSSVFVCLAVLRAACLACLARLGPDFFSAFAPFPAWERSRLASNEPNRSSTQRIPACRPDSPIPVDLWLHRRVPRHRRRSGCTPAFGAHRMVLVAMRGNRRLVPGRAGSVSSRRMLCLRHARGRKPHRSVSVG